MFTPEVQGILLIVILGLTLAIISGEIKLYEQNGLLLTKQFKGTMVFGLCWFKMIETNSKSRRGSR